MSRSSATSLMVRKASGALSKCSLLYCFGIRTLVGLAFAVAGVVTVDALLQDGRRLEHHHAARRDRHFGTGLRIAADPLALLAHHEGTKGRKLHRLALLEAIGNLLQYQFDKRR